MQEIRLQLRSWFFNPDKQLGPSGGFGRVYFGEGTDGSAVAIKKLNIDSSDSAHREFRVGEALADKTLKHIIPIYDSGEDANSGGLFLVMPMAARSLQQEIDARSVLDQSAVIDILDQIASGIAELNGLVHRDLKPANILLHEDKWKIADFGIARFVEESTSLHTLRDCLSPQYAAPEQWRFERAKVATDLYALGCIGYALITGNPPFTGSDSNDFREQHCNTHPPELPADVHPHLRTLISLLLRKVPEMRPDLTRVRAILRGLNSQPELGTKSDVAKIAARIEREHAEQEAKAEEERAKSRLRNDLASASRVILNELIERLATRVLNEAPFCKKESFGFKLGPGSIHFPTGRFTNSQNAIALGAFSNSKIDVIAAETLMVQQSTPRYEWASSLLYCKLLGSSGYRWYEVSFMSTFSGPERMTPFSLVDAWSSGAEGFRDLDLALSNTMHRYQAAFGPVPVDDENEDDFSARWIAILASAASGRLKYPPGLPLAANFWESFRLYGFLDPS